MLILRDGFPPYFLLEDFVIDTVDRYLATIDGTNPVQHIGQEVKNCVVLGDTHGAVDVTAYALQHCADTDLVVFAGDIVDRGQQQLLNLLLALEYSMISKKAIIVRGNHESIAVNIYYGFTEELKNFGLFDSVYPHIAVLYGKLPLACIIRDEVIVVHGGIPRNARKTEEWDSLPMNDEEPSNQDSFEILWNDPREYIDGFIPSTRIDGAFLFGQDVFEAFMNDNKLSLFVRAHEVKKDGYQKMFEGRLISVFSSRYHNGKAAILNVNFGSSVETSFDIVPEYGTEEWERTWQHQ